MKARVQGLLLFSFAFSSVLSAAEVLIPSKSIDTKILDLSALRLSNNSRRSTNEVDHKLEKRETEIIRSTLNPAFSSQKGFDGLLLNSNVMADQDDLNNPNRLDSDDLKEKEYQRNGPESCCQIEMENIEPAIDKRDLRNYKELLGGKRAPLAFHGMRGKKSEYYENGWPVHEVLDVGDFPAKQKFLIASGLLDEGNEILELEDPEWSTRKEDEAFDEEPAKKRSPYSFQGMRGKKTTTYDFKRAMGFLGMRGKKAPEVWSSDYFKRAPQTAFFGMKGKRAQSGFFGMRGKKSLLPNSYGVPGFGEPLGYDFQGINFLDEIKDRRSSNRFRRGDGQLSSVKKTKNAFFGVKGKKSTEEDSRSSLFSSNK